MTRTELKMRAKQKLAGNWGWAVGIAAILLIVNFIFGFSIYRDISYRFLETDTDISVVSAQFNISVGTNGLQFLISILEASISLGFLHLVDSRKDDDSFSAAFSGFREKRGGIFLLTWLLQVVFTFLWALLFIIPGLIKAYSYSMAYYIVDDLVRQNRSIAPTEAITKSRRLMDGHKFDLFVLDLSFIGWGILCLFTLGIGYLWLIPYMHTTRAEFYRALVAQNPAIITEQVQ